MTAKRILLVDDQRDVTRMLRAALETLGRGYVIVDVPSGEEALLEIGRGGVDLLITDVRLPGISGVEVVKRLKKLDAAARAIVISGQTDVPFEAEAKRLGAAYFSKPLRMDDFIQVVQRALGEPPSARPVEPGAPEQPPGIADRLAALRRDLGANAVFLVDRDGRIVVRAGDVTRLDMDAVLTELMTAFGASMKLCRLLGAFIPSNVHFFDGDEFDVYAANVGQFFAIVIVFDGERGAGQMGPVMRYGRQCADDLLNSLVSIGATPEPAPTLGPSRAPAPAAEAPAPPPRAAAPPAPPQRMAASVAPPPKPLTEEEIKALDEAAKKVSREEAASFWDSVLDEAEEAEVRPDALSWEQAEKLGLVPKK
jgi:FixJ family two-component response regulator